MALSSHRRLVSPRARRRTTLQRSASSRMRWPLLALGMIAAMLVAAYVDGGEEPLRPIVQPVEYSGDGA